MLCYFAYEFEVRSSRHGGPFHGLAACRCILSTVVATDPNDLNHGRPETINGGKELPTFGSIIQFA